MKILFVIDEYDDTLNSTTIAARQLADELKRRGHVISFLSTGEEKPNKIILESRKAPLLAKKYLETNHITLAKPDIRSMRRAIRGQDVVHFFYPFKLSREGIEIANEMGVATTASFVVQPENVTQNLGFGNSKMVNNMIYSKFAKFYNDISHISCLSENTKSLLEEHNYTSNVHVIPNGVTNSYHYRRIDKPERFQERIVITMTGNFSKEKDQETLIKAVKLSKYSKYIHLILAGEGVEQEKYEAELNKLHLQYTMNHYPENDLREILSYTDIYVHSTLLEQETINCLEAIALGNVPIIINNSEGMAMRYALDERSLYDKDNSQELADKIDYWIEHQTELNNMRNKYAKVADKYRISDEATLYEKMFAESIKDHLKSSYLESVHQTNTMNND